MPVIPFLEQYGIEISIIFYLPNILIDYNQDLLD